VDADHAMRYSGRFLGPFGHGVKPVESADGTKQVMCYKRRSLGYGQNIMVHEEAQIYRVRGDFSSGLSSAAAECAKWEGGKVVGNYALSFKASDCNSQVYMFNTALFSTHDELSSDCQSLDDMGNHEAMWAGNNAWCHNQENTDNEFIGCSGWQQPSALTDSWVWCAVRNYQSEAPTSYPSYAPTSIPTLKSCGKLGQIRLNRGAEEETSSIPLRKPIDKEQPSYVMENLSDFADQCECEERCKDWKYYIIEVRQRKEIYCTCLRGTFRRFSGSSKHISGPASLLPSL